jgi:hypothetical protein
LSWCAVWRSRTISLPTASPDSPRGAAKIRAGENDAGADYSNADLTGPIHSEQEGCIGIHSTGGPKQITSDDRHRISGQRGRVGREAAQKRGDEGGGRTAQRQAAEKQGTVLRKAAGEQNAHDGAAEVPAQNGLSSSSQKATYSGRQTEAHNRNPKVQAESGGPVSLVRRPPPGKRV